MTSGLAELFVDRRPPDHIRSDNGSEFTAKAVREWLARVGVKTLYIAPGSPWENGYTQSVQKTEALVNFFNQTVRIDSSSRAVSMPSS